MIPADFIYSNIYKGALRAGSAERAAKDHACMGLDELKRGKYAGKPSRLIEDRIRLAVSASKKQ